ncbi:response regulator transcription factor [Phycicoccus sonneratiae]|uniref:Response regulator transcription factor n=1 Tax=Phycicoccus sonneratiae TaxID=2807628 RepID=A0ABS2CI95_9MICO|nr:response regulator transcription factor [Phycicoccus sonneraticus]MBM6399589.1 response regulator transcription factor [Phycicoccus sonneraticus]
MTRQTALVVEDSPEFSRIASTLLANEGFRVVTATTGDQGVEAARKHAPELVLLDVTLPGLDGIEVCRQIREFSDCYVVMVTGRTDELDRVLGLTMGADDYVTKPFSPRELTARIRAMRRRPRVSPDPEVRSFGRLTLDPVAREVLVEDEVVELTRIEYDLLDTLTASPRRTFTRTQLMDAVWGGDWVGDDHVIVVHLANLRRKLGENADRKGFIRTVRGFGYRFEPVAAHEPAYSV